MINFFLPWERKVDSNSSLIWHYFTLISYIEHAQNIRWIPVNACVGNLVLLIAKRNVLYKRIIKYSFIFICHILSMDVIRTVWLYFKLLKGFHPPPLLRSTTPVSTIHWPNVGSRLDHPLRRWFIIELTLSQCIVFARTVRSHVLHIINTRGYLGG